MAKSTVEDIEVAGKRVLLRVDFNVEQNKDGSIRDDGRLRASLATVNYLVERGARVVICSHLDRPNGKVVPEYSLKPIALRLSELLGKPVASLGDCIGTEVEKSVSQMKAGDVVLLENLRFHAGEEANDPEFARALSRLGDVFVNDAFAVSHRAHASVVGVTRYLPAVAGYLMDKELGALGRALENPARPFASLVGGAKVSDKLAVLENIVKKVDILLVGGGMVATFLKSKGYPTGASPVENDKVAYVTELMKRAEARGVKLILPADVIVTEKIEEGAAGRIVPATAIPDGLLIADIGPKATAEFSRELKKCRTVLWNGPMGVFELGPFASGTKQLAGVIAGLGGAVTIVGGGSTAEAVRVLGLADKMSHVSTGGGASLEFLEGKVLPGVAALNDKT